MSKLDEVKRYREDIGIIESHIARLNKEMGAEISPGDVLCSKTGNKLVVDRVEDGKVYGVATIKMEISAEEVLGFWGYENDSANG